jgi:hypothetical protein
MPIETFTAFVVEQAVGLTIGVMAVTVAPKVVRGTQKMRADGGTAVLHTITSQLATAPHWYSQQWQTLYAEAQATRHTAVTTHVTKAELLAALGRATAVSDLHGRVRLQLPNMRHNEARASAYRQALADVPGISRSHVNTTSGRVLIHYELAYYPSLDSLREALVANNNLLNL